MDVTPTAAGPQSPSPPASRPPAASTPPPPSPSSSSSEDEIFAALASPVRREVLRLLRERGPRSVQELASGFSMARPSFSEHLRVLREAGLVSERRDGRRRLYSLEPVPLVRVRDWLDPYERFWRDKLSALRHLLDDAETADTGTTTDSKTTDTTTCAGGPPYDSGGGPRADQDEERP
ncbi:ArsR/SmtB family transcription factor [Microbispora hainanensis]|uniref:ArsR/SmtB family transcription factor n=1 Tax=Microbispora hainanensis TaxID=568844 RepID=UPI001FCAB4D5|nr:metalloregulator ArsR/SmtB family transcription factor [Microbispora hainanensis]